MILLSQAKSRYVLICGNLAAPLKRSGAHRKTAPLSRALESCPATSQVAWLSKLTVNPLLNSAGRHAHEIRLRLADRNGIADLEFPFPQPRLHLGKAEFNTPAVHLETLRLACNQAIQRRRNVCSKQNSFQVVPGSVLVFLEAGAIVD